MTQKEINVYLDESSHLKYDKQRAMVLGFVSCDKDKVAELSKKIREIKIKHKVPKFAEIKWHKVSRSKEAFYIELLEFFLREKDLNYRSVIFANKDLYSLNHNKYRQTYDEWTYAMCFWALNIINKEDIYNIYLDKRQTYSTDKLNKLRTRLSQGYNIKILQNILSHQSELMQLTDFLNGIIGYYNKGLCDRPDASETKKNLVQIMSRKSKVKLNATSKLTDKKINLFFWEPQNV